MSKRHKKLLFLFFLRIISLHNINLRFKKRIYYVLNIFLLILYTSLVYITKTKQSTKEQNPTKPYITPKKMIRIDVKK